MKLLKSIAFYVLITAMITPNLVYIYQEILTPTYSAYQVLPDLEPLHTSDAVGQYRLKYSPMIRLHNTSKATVDGFFCSAFVISNIYAITAAHCLVDSSYKMTKKSIYVHDMYNIDTLISADAVAVNLSADIGMIRGDFKEFNKVKVATTAPEVSVAQGPFITCGFPYGDAVFCSDFRPISNFFSQLQGPGHLYPGMSGGPVVSLTEGIVVGVNSAMLASGAVISPMIGFFASIGLLVK